VTATATITPTSLPTAPTHPTHPLGSHARVLLSSVFGPYAQDDKYGSRKINPMELFHNQVTRMRGPFSLRMFHRPWGLLLIQANISAPCRLLDFPDLERFTAEITTNKYDVIGIRVLGSTIIGLEEHTPENIDAAIDHAVSHDTDFHQFMLYMPIPGTPLYAEHQAAGTLLDPDDFPEADIHGQYKFSYRHAHIKGGQETEFLLRAFRRDFEVNGLSIVRLARTMLQGRQSYKDLPTGAIRNRFAWYGRELGATYAAALWAARNWFRGEPALVGKISRILKDIYRAFGLRSRLAAPLVGGTCGS
jgi:hypothetical protein